MSRAKPTLASKIRESIAAVDAAVLKQHTFLRSDLNRLFKACNQHTMEANQRILGVTTSQDRGEEMLTVTIEINEAWADTRRVCIPMCVVNSSDPSFEWKLWCGQKRHADALEKLKAAKMALKAAQNIVESTASDLAALRRPERFAKKRAKK